ncbi:hypothetical protein B0A50_01673 [Salinomyces thailandicus]|uniref:AB hydrolase-1 domain-containing protein n=1 Tax=Salinomyces thailandicus TaxID=706561 RepID=A0A4U0UE00_9PEZI|nr:hypothetical protein B0A50_01673 [Salinomyces thailandica]
MDTLRHLHWERRTLYLALTAPLLAYTTLRLLRPILLPPQAPNHIIPSPRQALEPLNSATQNSPDREKDDLPYPPNALPGARDVSTPYGSIRVYEWGPETGRKVLLVHGISTPCIALARIAQLLVEREGCRVMLFDLFGRGYSDTPDPEQYRQDLQLFTTQILLVLSSSKLAWMGGGERFTLMGYSLGGGISAAFTADFPEMVGSLVSIAPSGLIRPGNITVSSKLIYGGLLPSGLVNYFVGRRLRGNPKASALSSANPEATTTGAVSAAESEVPGHPAHAADSSALIFPGRAAISPANAVAWQVDAHPGFLPAFVSSIKHAPVTGQHARWKRIGDRQAARRASAEPEKAPAALRELKTLVLLGEQDTVIVADEVGPDTVKVMGAENVEVVRLEGGHDLPIVNASGCVDAVIGFWR